MLIPRFLGHVMRRMGITGMMHRGEKEGVVFRRSARRSAAAEKLHKMVLIELYGKVFFGVTLTIIIFHHLHKPTTHVPFRLPPALARFR